MIAKPSYDELRSLRHSIGASWFLQPWDLNLLIGRSDNVGLYDDAVFVAATDDAGRPLVEAFVATGDASESEWKNPQHPHGCIYVLDGTYPAGLRLGTFKGRPALRQVQPFNCVRWPRDRGRIPTVTELEALPPFFENRGVHIHNRWNDDTPEVPLTGDSRGCTVILYPHHHVSLMRLGQLQKARHGVDTFSPTYFKLSALAA